MGRDEGQSPHKIEVLNVPQMEYIVVIIMQQQGHEYELTNLRNRIAELERELQTQHVSHKDWIRNNLEEAQQIIDNIVGIKGITEDPDKAAAELEALVELTSNTDMTNMSNGYGYGYGYAINNVIATNMNGTPQREVIVQPPHDELYGY